MSEQAVGERPLREQPAAGTRLLLVEDDPDLGAAMVGLLAGASYTVQWAKDAARAHALVATEQPDLVLLDLGLPDADGLELCAQLRSQLPEVVLVVVTARSDEAAAVQALDGGADDFVSKPFRPAELISRLRAHLRRADTADLPDVRCGAVQLDLRSRRAWVSGQLLDLRPKEHELLTYLVQRAGTAVRREEIMDQVWDEAWHGSTKTLDVHIANLRRKLADLGEPWDRITTLRGFGYRFETGSAEPSAG